MPASVDTAWHRRHDVFNLAALPIVVVSNISYLTTVVYYSFQDGEDQALISRINGLYQFMFGLFIAYMAVDTLWLLIKPRSVASPVFIIAHHIVSVAGWLTPLLDARLRPWTAACVSVEFNTIFLIARRNYRSSYWLDLGFISSWIALRLGLYPYMVVKYYFVFKQYLSPMTGLNVINTGYACLLLLMGLNLKWSLDLHRKFDSFFKQDINVSSGVELKGDKGL